MTDQEYWLSVFEYKNGELLWKKRLTKQNSHRIGSVAGGRNKTTGYWRIVHHYKGRTYWERHRIVWEMFNGPIPEGLVINHINGVRGDDRIENLELTTSWENTSPPKVKNKWKTNTTGYTGISIIKKTGKYRAGVGYNYKFINLGHFDTLEEAIDARDKAVARISQGFPPREEKPVKRKGISFNESTSRWRVYKWSKEEGKVKNLGNFKTLFDAACFQQHMYNEESYNGSDH